MRIKKYRWLLYMMSGVLMLSGCGTAKQTQDIPVLEDPVFTNEAYRPVTYGTVGNYGELIDSMGLVVPEEQCYFYTSAATIDHIYVNIGDYVRSGTVLASVNLENDKRELENIQDELTYENKKFQVQEELHDVTVNNLQKQILECEEKAEKESYKKQLKIEKESQKYDRIMHKRIVRRMKEEMAEKKKILENGTLTARQDGYVTYIVDITSSGDVEASQNVVIVSDYEHARIEDSGHTLNDAEVKDLEEIYTVVNGKRYDLARCHTDAAALAAMQAAGGYIYTSFDIPDGVTMQIGQSYPLYYVGESVDHVLVVANDSIKTSGNETYVYVKTKQSDKEKRIIKTGASDMVYTEVKEGLEENELVYYSQPGMIPIQYQSQEISLASYACTMMTQMCKKDDTREYAAYAEETYSVIDVLKQEGDTVKKGESILKIRSNEGKADLLQVKQQLSQAKESFAKATKEHDKAMKQLKKKGDLYAIQKESLEYRQSKVEYDYTICNLKKQEQELKQLNDGNGYRYIKAREEGVVTKMAAQNGGIIREGDLTFVITYTDASSKRIAVTLQDNMEDTGTQKSAAVNQKVSIYAGDSIFEGLCVASAPDYYKAYITYINGKYHVTRCICSENENRQSVFYVETEDQGILQTDKINKVSYQINYMQSAYVVPVNCVYTEKEQETQTEYEYVWKLVDGELVKQYVKSSVDARRYDSGKRVLICGVSEGDVVIREVTDTKE